MPTRQKMNFHWLITLTAITATGFLASCKSSAPPPAPIESKLSYSWLGFPQPCATPKDAKILIEKWIPKIAKPGETFDIKLQIQNNADYKISHFSLVEELPDKFNVTKIIPSTYKADAKKIQWQIDDFSPGKSKDFTIKGTIKNVGSVRYTGSSILYFETNNVNGGESVVSVIAPDLNLELYAPSSAIINKRIPVELTFKNAGTAPVKNTKLFYTLPKGILTFDGKSDIQLNIGNLLSSESKSKQIDIKGVTTGNYKLNFTAIADGNIEASSPLNLSITKPQLYLNIKVPGKRFVGNVIPYSVIVKNTGNAVAENTVIKLSLPDGISLASIDNNGIKNGSVIAWNIGTLHINESKTVSAKVVANRIMTARASATADATAADKLEVAKTTDVAGISALLCTLDDVNDPVPVGEQEEYVLIATNQGSLPATKIVAKCYIEDNMEYIKSTGATKGKIEGNVIIFEPLPELSPQAEAKWTIYVKAIKPGDARFKAEVMSEQLTKPVTLIEPTNFYE
jgi:uncharacterized repeat protein (TIGR01451 family)